MKYNSAQTACESFTYGEVEDYTVNIGQTANTVNSEGENQPLGTSEAAFGINIYPNPAKNILNVELLDNRQATYKIYNVLGQQVLNGSINRTATINVDTLSNGLYLVKINDGQKELVERFIKE